MTKAVILFSGGVDSTTLLYDEIQAGRTVFPLSIDYGQRHVREIESAAKICEALGVSLFTLRLPNLRLVLGGSSQTSEMPVPHGHYSDESMKQTVVPNRNMIFLSIAIGYAISIDAQEVAYAAHAGDHAIYPDCRPEFVAAMRPPAGLCHYDPIEISAPYMNLTKAEVVTFGRAFKIPVPYEMTWTCYQGEALHCGKCGACVERKEALGMYDPTRYES